MRGSKAASFLLVAGSDILSRLRGRRAPGVLVPALARRIAFRRLRAFRPYLAVGEKPVSCFQASSVLYTIGQ
jgi:hypothetical protein